MKLLAERGVVLSLPPMSKAHAEQVLQKLSAEKPEAAVFDYDDTLEPQEQAVSPETAAALSAVADNGIETMILTARSDASILESLAALTPAQKAKLAVGSQRGARIAVFGKDGQASVVREEQGAAQVDKSLGVRALRAESAFYARARDVLRFVPKALRGWAMKLVARLPKRSIPAVSVVLVGDHFEGAESIDGAMIEGAPGALALSVGGYADPRLENVFVWPERGPAGTKRIMEALAKKSSGGVETRPLKGLFAARSVSIVAYILTMLAYPFLAIPVVGPAGFGALMGWGAMGAIATGPLNGLIVSKLSARNAMALTAVLRAVLALALPLFSFFGVLNFGTLLVASIANGWALSSLMTTESIYIKRWAGPKLGEMNNGAFLNYLVIFGLMTLIIGVGAYVDGWNLSVPFFISAVAHLAIVLPILWKFIPNVAPPKAEVRPRRPDAAARVRGWAAGVAGFLRKYWKEALLFAAGMGAYFWTGTTIAAALALVWWIRATDGFKLLWSDKKLRLGALFMAGAAFLFFPLQSLTLPLVAKALAGEAGRAALLGQLVGALFFGQLISSSGQAKFGRLRLPFVGRFPAQRLIQAGVLAMAAAWVYMTLAPGSLLAAAAAVGLGAALMALSARLTQMGWIKLFGIGLAAVLVPLLAWGNIPLLFTSLLLLGLFYGPASVAFTNYFFGSMPKEQAGAISGVQSSLFNAAITLGYGVMSLLLSTFTPALPGAIAAIGVGFVALALLSFLAPRFMPGLPGSVFKKKGER